MTPKYAATEQVRGQPVITATDIYSLGVILYELLTRHRPFLLKSQLPVKLEQAICARDPQRPSTAVNRTEDDSNTTLDGIRQGSVPNPISYDENSRATWTTRAWWH
jgi:serine/threonine protein kinase